MSKEPIQIGECVPERQSHVASQMERAAQIQKRGDELLGELNECLHGLSSRISGVLRGKPIPSEGKSQGSPAEGKSQGSPAKEIEILVDLAEELREINSQSLEQNVQIQDTISYVRGLTERVEL